MRWIVTKRPSPEAGTKTTQRMFLLFPLTLENKDGAMETRWLETVNIEYEWSEKIALAEGGGSYYYAWVAKRWGLD